VLKILLAVAGSIAAIFISNAFLPQTPLILPMALIMVASALSNRMNYGYVCLITVMLVLFLYPDGFLYHTRAMPRYASLLFLLAIPSILLTTRVQRQKDKIEIAQKDSARAVAVRDNMMATLSHELKTPITAIRMIADLTAKTSKCEQSLRNAQTIKDAAERMTQLIDDLLDLSRMEAGNLKLVIQPCPVLHLVEAVVKANLLLAEAKNIQIELQVEDVLVPCDEKRVNQVITNLLTNAIKYAPPNSTISIHASVRDGSLYASVKDAGRGIRASDLEHIFDRFWQAENARAGSGLGLTIARNIVESHRGKIWAESELGRGSVFHFTLPVAS